MLNKRINEHTQKQEKRKMLERSKEEYVKT